MDACLICMCRPLSMPLLELASTVVAVEVTFKTVSMSGQQYLVQFYSMHDKNLVRRPCLNVKVR